ncbi:MAG: protein arginine kinase [Phycisphaerales bacterium]|nr:protein arginine kinase [Phycisphaerales bacterium]
MFESGTEWLRAEGSATDVVLSSRVRLARNLAGLPFVSKAGRGDLRLVLEAARPAIERAALDKSEVWIDLHDASEIERALLLERHLISNQLAKGKPAPKSGATEWPRAVCFGLPGERASVMINEEDHIRLQCIRSGMALREAWRDADAIDDRLESHIDLAFSPRLGYLTACPTNVGTGVRFSVMLHLPGLRMSGEIERVRRAASDMSLAVRGFYGEGSEASGDFYQLSNQTTLGKSELLLLEELDGRIIPEVIEYERQARQSLLSKRRWQVEDTVHRAFGVLQHARLLRTEEAMKLLSVVRLGICLELLGHAALGDVQTLMLLIQPAHLQRTCGREMGQDERRRARADVVRERFAEH